MINKETIKKSQYRNLAIVVGAMLVVFTGFYFLLVDKQKPVAQVKAADFASPLQHIDAESVIIEKTEARLAAAEKNTAELKEKLTELNNKQEKPTQENEDVKHLSQRLTDIEKKISVTNSIAPPSQNFSGSIFPQPPGAAGITNPQGQSMIATSMPSIRDDAITLSPSADALSVPLRNPETYVPAGTFVKAVAIGGADASAAVNAQSNPVPMLFKIVEAGTMPNKQKSRLQGCLATAAVVGDISSERGLIRLETLSCIDPDSKRIVDMPVEGTVFGPEGKNGVRGTPVWREGALLQRAFVAGTLSGFANGISQKYTTTSISPLGSTQSIKGSDIFKYGAASGASNAMEKLAEYNIQRAEQYHPVIQLSAGTVVDLVFLKGFYLDGQKHDDVKQNDVSLSSFPQPPSTPSPINTTSISADTPPQLPLTPEQIERLKAIKLQELNTPKEAK